MEDKSERAISLQDLVDFLSGLSGPETAARWRRQLQDPDSPESRLLADARKLPDYAFRLEVLNATAVPLEEALGAEQDGEVTLASDNAPCEGEDRAKDKTDWRDKVEDSSHDKARGQEHKDPRIH